MEKDAQDTQPINHLDHLPQYRKAWSLDPKLEQPYDTYSASKKPLEVGDCKTDLKGNIEIGTCDPLRIPFNRVLSEPDTLATYYTYEGFTPCYLQSLRNLDKQDFTIKVYRAAKEV